MKRLTILTIATLLLGATAPDANTDVEQVIIDYFEAVRTNDRSAAYALCTDDYVLVDEGSFLDNDSLFAVLGPLYKQGVTITYRFDGFTTTVKGNIAWTYYHSLGEITINGETSTVTWAESAVLVQRSGRWMLALLHSTTVSEGPAR